MVSRASHFCGFVIPGSHRIVISARSKLAFLSFQKLSHFEDIFRGRWITSVIVYLTARGEHQTEQQQQRTKNSDPSKQTEQTPQTSTSNVIGPIASPATHLSPISGFQAATKDDSPLRLVKHLLLPPSFARLLPTARRNGRLFGRQCGL